MRSDSSAWWAYVLLRDSGSYRVRRLTEPREIALGFDVPLPARLEDSHRVPLGYVGTWIAEGVFLWTVVVEEKEPGSGRQVELIGHLIFDRTLKVEIGLTLVGIERSLWRYEALARAVLDRKAGSLGGDSQPRVRIVFGSPTRDLHPVQGWRWALLLFVIDQVYGGVKSLTRAVRHTHLALGLGLAPRFKETYFVVSLWWRRFDDEELRGLIDATCWVDCLRPVDVVDYCKRRVEERYVRLEDLRHLFTEAEEWQSDHRLESRNSNPWRSVGDRNPRTLADYRARERAEDEPWRRRDDEIDRDRRTDRYRQEDGYYRGGRFEQYPWSPRYDRNPDGFRSPRNFTHRGGGDSRRHWEPNGDRRDRYRGGYDRADRGRDTRADSRGDMRDDSRGDRRDDSCGRYDRGGYPALSGYPKSTIYPRSPGLSNQSARAPRGPPPRAGKDRPPTPRSTCVYCKADDHVKRDCPDLKRAIDDGIVVLDDRKYVKWTDDLGDVSMFPSMKENVDARRVRPSKGKEVARSRSIMILMSSDEDAPTTPIRVAATKSARPSSSKKADTDYVMAEKDGQRIDEEEVILSPRKREARKFTIKSSLDGIDTVEPLRRVLRQPMQCSILEYLTASRPARDELQMITRKTRIPLGDEAQVALKPEAPTVEVSSVTAKADRAATVFLDGKEGIPPDKFYILGSETVEVILNDEETLERVIDNESEAVIIEEGLAVLLGLDLDRSYYFEIETAAGKKQKVNGVCYKAAIEVEGLRFRMQVFAVKGCSSELLLGRTWLSHVHAVTIERPDESQMLSIKRSDGGRIMIETVEPRDPRNRAALAAKGEPDRIALGSRSFQFREKKYGLLLTEEEGRIVEIEDLGSRILVNENSYPKDEDKEFGGMISVSFLRDQLPTGGSLRDTRQ
ncbi:hypothetical protein CBR_g52313 [Chara braunii]|uniref:CCHC-type domain-containing protein n=1 Tax=Chara braunii TaxID=69332 RepID=A0A388K6N8_CHABU|nr:hypothetical protein CBR_g52313 [Chara braunii]|eukprot:GBG65718.1 hypothetical protein CBR_g52313 [Chara braunii]